jgi:hypothetical protein
MRADEYYHFSAFDEVHQKYLNGEKPDPENNPSYKYYS